MVRLLDHHKVPPGQYWYEQTFEKDGRSLKKKWGSTPEIGSLAAKVAGFRKANGLPRANIMDALEDIDSWTCQRLGNNPKWCHDTDAKWEQIVASFHGPGCATCNKTSPP